MNIRHQTISGMSLFKSDIVDSFILHIPHASTHIPNYNGFHMDKVAENIDLLTDWATDRIFDVDRVEKIVTPYSRLFCDVERFDDEAEPMHGIGRGFFYTNGYDGTSLRKHDPELKMGVYKDFYLKHHDLFYEKVKERLDEFGVCHVLDCHSFNDAPIVPFNDNPKSPDICIGTDPFHTPDYLLRHTLNYFANRGYSVEVNNPYSGCIVPKPYFKSNGNVKGIMVEINKRIYMDAGHVVDEKVEHLRLVLNDFFNDL